MAIKVEKDRVILDFNHKFYSKEAIINTKKAYAGICEVKFEKSMFRVILKPKEKKDIDILGREFYNYCLGMMK